MQKPLLIGVAGGSASGKSTLSQKLAQALSTLHVEILPMDRYFRPVKPQMVAPITGRIYDDYNHPDSFDLAALLHDLDALLSCASAPQVLIVEGLMTLVYEPLRTRLDLGIFVDAQSDERLARRLKRNMARGMAFDEVAEFYLDTVRFRHQEFVEPSRWHADIVLNGTHPSERGFSLVVDWICHHVSCPPASDSSSQEVTPP